jgi:AcrR family transcriptional regulator
MQDTPHRLREAAERLLTERNEARISLRDITEAAGANVASVGYHFGSKDALLAQVIRSAFVDVTARQQAQLESLPEDAGLEQLVRTWLAPALQSPGGGDEKNRRHWRVLQRAVAEPSPATLALMAEMAQVVDTHLLSRIARHVPHLSAAELRFRHAATLGALGSLTAGGIGTLLRDQDPDDFAEQFVAWVIGGLTAPATRPAAV